MSKSTYERLNRGYHVEYDEVKVEDAPSEAEKSNPQHFIEIVVNDPFQKYDKEKVLKAHKIPEIDKKIVYDRHLSFLSVMLEWERQGKCPNKKNLYRILAYI